MSFIESAGQKTAYFYRMNPYNKELPELDKKGYDNGNQENYA